MQRLRTARRLRSRFATSLVEPWAMFRGTLDTRPRGPMRRTNRRAPAVDLISAFASVTIRHPACGSKPARAPTRFRTEGQVKFSALHGWVGKRDTEWGAIEI